MCIEVRFLNSTLGSSFPMVLSRGSHNARLKALDCPQKFWRPSHYINHSIQEHPLV